ncbi:MAG: hypothetical protein GXO71_06095 [Caldiserica bacterium]|nr:hypothetical protein [Caldisericota bacterium]
MEIRKVKRDTGLLKRRVLVFSSISPPTMEKIPSTLTPNSDKRIVASPISRISFFACIACIRVNMVNAGLARIKRYAPTVTREKNGCRITL